MLLQTPIGQRSRPRVANTDEIRNMHQANSMEQDNDIPAVQQDFANLSVIDNPSTQVSEQLFMFAKFLKQFNHVFCHVDHVSNCFPGMPPS